MKSTIHELQKNNFKIVSKKFMFSAVALIAFSFAGLASNGEVEKLEVKENMKELKIITEDPGDLIRDCQLDRFIIHSAALASGISPSFASYMGWSVYWQCMNNNISESIGE